MKKKSVRANDGPFKTKALRKAIMKRSCLRNRFNKNRTDDNKKAFKKQKNLCVKLLREAKRDYYANIDLKSLNDNWKFKEVQIKRLNPKKESPKGSIPARILKENSDLLVPHVISTYIACISEVYFPDELKARDISSLYKKMTPSERKITDPLLCCRQFPRFLNDSCMSK